MLQTWHLFPPPPVPLKTSPQIGWFNLLSTYLLKSLLACLSVSALLMLCCPCYPPQGVFLPWEVFHTPWICPGWVRKAPLCRRCRSSGPWLWVVKPCFPSLNPANVHVIISPPWHISVVLGICLIQGWQSHDSGDVAFLLPSPTSLLCTAFDKLLLFSSCCLVYVLYAPDALFKWHPFRRHLQEEGFHLLSLLLLQGNWLVLIKTVLKVQ